MGFFVEGGLSFPSPNNYYTIYLVLNLYSDDLNRFLAYRPEALMTCPLKELFF